MSQLIESGEGGKKRKGEVQRVRAMIRANLYCTVRLSISNANDAIILY